jgi:hypothetical protein
MPGLDCQHGQSSHKHGRRAGGLHAVAHLILRLHPIASAVTCR